MKMTSLLKNAYFLFVVTFFAVFAAPQAFAELQVDINRGTVQPLPVAITDFKAQNANDIKLGKDMADIIRGNLDRSGLFEVIPSKQFPAAVSNETMEKPFFAEWRTVKAEALVTGAVTKTPDGKTRVEFRLWDVFAEKQMTGLAYTTTPDNWRRIAHIISDEIYKRMTGEEGYFDSRIVYVSESGSALKRTKKLSIMDQDGANVRYLTAGNELVLTPRFSPSSQTITYLSYYNNTPRVYLYDLNSGRQKVLGDFKGMTFSPRFSPDGKEVVMSYSTAGSSDIYTMDINGGKPKRLTDHPAIDTGPSYAPDGRSIVFESDRSGTQQLYVMDSNGSNQRRITFGDGRYGNPVWSPRGDLIAFTKLRGGLFYIGVISPDGSNERLITQAYHVEGPTWSPNGRVLSYFKESSAGKDKGNVSKIYTIDLTGYNESQLKTPEGASDPAWSPLNR